MPWVEPERRRRGIGSAVLAELVAICRADHRTDLVLETAYPFERREDHPYRRFAEKNGFSLANTEIRRVRTLPVDDVDLEALAAEAAQHHAGYRIETFEDPHPRRAAAVALRRAQPARRRRSRVATSRSSPRR